MLDKLNEIEEKYRLMEARMADPSLISDTSAYAKLMKEYKYLSPIVEKYREYKRAEQEISDALELISEADDEEMRKFASDELNVAKATVERLTRELRVLLIPRDPNDDRSVIVEIRACAGGEEAALFSAVLYRMYSMYCTQQGYKMTLLHANETDLGGFREVTFSVDGDGVWSHFKFESGVHRVQRVPETESQGRIQTSTATVAVLPEVEPVEVEIKDSDLTFESCKSSGAGGQHINKTESAIRLTHKPSGIVVECDSERSQFQNKDRAIEMLRAKLYDIKQREQDELIAGTRRSQVGTGDRSEKIRTYNYPQSRITDHRINLSIYNMDSFLNGNLNLIIEPLLASETADKLKAEN